VHADPTTVRARLRLDGDGPDECRGPSRLTGRRTAPCSDLPPDLRRGLV